MISWDSTWGLCGACRARGLCNTAVDGSATKFSVSQFISDGIQRHRAMAVGSIKPLVAASLTLPSQQGSEGTRASGKVCTQGTNLVGYTVV